MEPKDPEWLRGKEVARRYGLKECYVHNLRRNNPEVGAMTRKLPGIRGPVLFNRKQFDEWVDSQKVKPLPSGDATGA
jgi:hypothetical protein